MHLLICPLPPCLKNSIHMHLPFKHYIDMTKMYHKSTWALTWLEPYRLSVWKQEWRPTKNGLVDACSNTCFSVWTQSISWRGEGRQTETEMAWGKDNVLINQFVWSIGLLRQTDVPPILATKFSLRFCFWGGTLNGQRMLKPSQYWKPSTS